MSNEIIPFNDMRGMAQAIAASGLFGLKTPDQALALMLIAQAEGRHPGIVARDYHLIQGRPALKADAMLARFQEAGGRVEWTAYTDECVTGVFAHPQGGSVTITWDKATATRAGLWSRDTWKAYPRAMLRARCISEGVRTVYPAVLSGMYTPEEVQDMPPLPPVQNVPRGTSEKPVFGETIREPAANPPPAPFDPEEWKLKLAEAGTLDELDLVIQDAKRHAVEAKQPKAYKVVKAEYDRLKAEAEAQYKASESEAHSQPEDVPF